MEERLETASVRSAFVDEENMDRPSEKYSSHYTGYESGWSKATSISNIIVTVVQIPSSNPAFRAFTMCQVPPNVSWFSLIARYT